MFRYSFITGLLLVGCNDASMMMRVTVGGNQDMNLARELIDQGMIPNRDSFSTEGLFSEHGLQSIIYKLDDLSIKQRTE